MAKIDRGEGSALNIDRLDGRLDSIARDIACVVDADAKLNRAMAALQQISVTLAGIQLDQWLDPKDAPEDEWVLLATSGEWVGQAIQYQDDAGKLYWQWADGRKVHPMLKPFKWMKMPKSPFWQRPSCAHARIGGGNDCKYCLDCGEEFSPEWKS